MAFGQILVTMTEMALEIKIAMIIPAITLFVSVETAAIFLSQKLC